MNHLITVIVPVYKVEQFLCRCVDSILSQSFGNLEVILVDDGSPDSCGRICDDYAKIDNRITVIHKENGGLSDARNSGLDICNGEFIAFIDSDDWIAKNYLEILYENLIKTKSDISVCNFLRLSEEDHLGDCSSNELIELTNIEALEKLNRELNAQLVTAWGKLIKKTLFNDLKFPLGKLHEDVFITYKLIHRAGKLCYSSKELYFYWQRENSIMGQITNRNRLDLIEAKIEQSAYYDQMGLPDLRVKNLLTTLTLLERFTTSSSQFTDSDQKNLLINEYKNSIHAVLGKENLSQKLRIKLMLKLHCPFFAKIIIGAYVVLLKYLRR